MGEGGIPLCAAQQVGVKLDKEADKLREAAAAYCLCARVYDPDRPMLSCDYCDGWFHFGCVGLPGAPPPSCRAPLRAIAPAASSASRYGGCRRSCHLKGLPIVTCPKSFWL